MVKGIMNLIESIIVAGLIIASFAYFFPRYKLANEWGKTLLDILLYDSMFTLERTGKLEEYVDNSTEMKSYLERVLPIPLIKWVSYKSSLFNQTEEFLEGLEFQTSKETVDIDYINTRRQNLNKNPGFEYGNVGDAYFWEEGIGFTRDSTVSKVGSYSLKYESTGTSYTVSERFEVEPLRIYRLSAWVLDSLSQGNITIDLNDTTGECELVPTIKNQWEFLQCFFNASTSNLTIRISVTDAQGTAWFDEVKVDTVMVERIKLAAGSPY